MGKQGEQRCVGVIQLLLLLLLLLTVQALAEVLALLQKSKAMR